MLAFKLLLGLFVIGISVYSLITGDVSYVLWNQLMLAILMFLLGWTDWREDKKRSGSLSMAVGIVIFLLFIHSIMQG
ncbi:hypothetical protein [Bacillus sp. FJAT-27251]|uniref:hypothetical protein n=1 Tax=Bacillus sp. FJAT-27251 TaxID=1684142 RepID=UPI0006A7ACDC|nr:hypothetical protein [Bacillus sp. FJAT-27251]